MNSRGQENLAYFQNAYVRAFAVMIMHAEGTTKYGYYTMFGGSKLPSLASHPNVILHLGGYDSSAAGAFQFLKDTWAGLKAKLALTDFSENSQNAAFVELLRENNALGPLMNGDFQTAVFNVRKVWASLPGAGYGQGEKSMSQVTAWFNDALQNPSLTPISNSNLNLGNVDWNSPATVLIVGILLYLLLE